MTAPWLIGGAEPWMSLSLSGLILVCGLLWLVGGWSDTRWRAGAFWAFAPVLLVAVQCGPIPHGLFHFLQPTLARLLTSLAEARGGLLRAGATLSCSPDATVRALYPALAAAVVFFVSAHALANRKRMKTALVLLLLNAFALALFSIVQALQGSRLIYGFYEPPLGGTFFGTFTNRNHFGTWMNLVIAAGWGFILYRLHTPPKDKQKTAGWERQLLPGFMVLIMFGSLLLSQSRGALAAGCLAWGLLVALLGPDFRKRRGLVILAGIAIGLVGLVAWLGLDTVFARLDKMLEATPDPLRDTRWLATVCTLRMGADAWLFGWGFGAFRHAFPMYQEPALQFGRFHYAHNDFAQLFAEGGVVAVALLIICVTVAIRHLVRELPSCSRRRKYLAMALVCGLAALAFQSLVDFGSHKPAIAYLAAWMAGCIAALTRAEPPSSLTLGSQAWDERVRQSRCRVGALLVMAACLVLLQQWPARFKAEIAFQHWAQSRHLLESRPTQDVQDWSAWDMTNQAEEMLKMPSRPDALMDVCQGHLAGLRNRRIEPEIRILFYAQASAAAAQAVAYAPTDYETWIWQGRMMALTNSLAANASFKKSSLLAPYGQWSGAR